MRGKGRVYEYSTRGLLTFPVPLGELLSVGETRSDHLFGSSPRLLVEFRPGPG